MPIFPPTGLLALAGWTPNFSAKLTAGPTLVGCTAADATAYAALNADFLARVLTNDDPATRTKVTGEQLRVSKTALLTKARQLCKIINAYPGTTDALRVSFGMNPRDLIPSPVPVPATRPQLSLDLFGNLRLVDETTPTRRGKPAGVFAAVLFTALLPAGAPAPATPDDARYAGLLTKDRFAVPLPADATGKVLWAMAQWVNSKGQAGPLSAVVSARIAA